jgi:uncharacterized membrane protein YgdD (TMEM256/DUF423 family)
MRSAWLAMGALACALAIAAGAFGAHALAARLDARELALWETAARYLMYAGLGLGVIGVALRQAPRPELYLAAPLLGGGALLFSGTLAGLALGGPRWLGAVTPVGGVLQVVAFLLVAWAALRG